MNLGAILVTGLFAGGVSCAAVQGGLLAGLVARQTGGSARRGTVARQKGAVARLADDLAPVGGFLAGKLVSHTLLGALLGALGAVVQLSATARAWAQLAAGSLIIAFGLAQLGVPGFRRFTVQPPAAWARFVRGRTRSASAFAPTLLGLATILVPCGVTLSVEALALTSGSPWAGAATLAVFVIGTSPLFAVLGYAARKAATAWQGRLAVVTGMIVLALGGYTLNGGLNALDSPFAARNIARTLGLSAPPATAETVTNAGGRQTAVVTARPAGERRYADRPRHRAGRQDPVPVRHGHVLRPAHRRPVRIVTPATVTYVFAVEGMHCGSCGMLIDETLEDLDGVVASTTSVRSGRSSVRLDPVSCDSARVIAAIAEAGYRTRLLAG